jgi:hypothetical protein
MKLTLTIIVFIAFLLTSCRELVQDDFPYFKPVPVINSILIADSLVKVHVSLAGKIDSNQLALIENAEVLLFVDGQYIEKLSHSGNGIYGSVAVAESQKVYSCEVTIPGYPKIVCTDSIPETSVISDIVHINQAGKDPEGIIYPAVKVTFTNDPSKNLYYELVIKMLKYGYEQRPYLISITDPVLLNEGIPIAVFSNEIIKGDSYTMSINYVTGSSSGHLFPLLVEFRSISYDYYQFVKQQYLYEQGRYPEFGSAFTSANLYSNVKGGYGIFAGYSSVQSDTINPFYNGK